MSAPRPPASGEWLHEIKHDGFRLMARRDDAGIGLLTRNGNDWTDRYALIVRALNALRCRSCLIDGEAVACDDGGVPVFQKLRRRTNDRAVFLIVSTCSRSMIGTCGRSRSSIARPR